MGRLDELDLSLKLSKEEEAEPVRTKSPAEQQLDQQIDASKDANVEVFLREQNRSKA